MNIDGLTIGEARQIAALLGGTDPSKSEKAHPMLGRHCVVRSAAEGVHIGTVTAISGTEVLLTDSRRLWYWKGAFTLSEVATKGVDKASRLAVEIPEIYITKAESIIPTTEAARKTYTEAKGE